MHRQARTLVPRAARPRALVQDRLDGERGSLVLDILIGMAIFALIAIIAISAIGQYRMRAYIQAAVSDASASADLLAQRIGDQVADGEQPVTPGDLDPAAQAALMLNATPGSTFRVSTSKAGRSAEDFEVCVEHKGAYAIYDTGLGGLQESGSIEGDHFAGCSPTPPERITCPTGQREVRALAYWGPDSDPMGARNIPGIEVGQFYFPNQIPGMTEAKWLDPDAPWAPGDLAYGESGWWADDTSDLHFDAWGWKQNDDGSIMLVDEDGNNLNSTAYGAVFTADGEPYVATVHVTPTYIPAGWSYGGVQDVEYGPTPAEYEEYDRDVYFMDSNRGFRKIRLPWNAGYDEERFRAELFDWWWTDVTGDKGFDTDGDGTADEYRPVTRDDFRIAEDWGVGYIEGTWVDAQVDDAWRKGRAVTSPASPGGTRQEWVAYDEPTWADATWVCGGGG